MIKINLLPVRAHKKRELGRQWVVFLAVVVVATGIGNYFWLSATETRVVEIKKLIAKYDNDNKELEKIIGEVKDIKKEKDEMRQKLGVLNKLKEGRTGPVRVLDELSAVVPPHVWILSWEETNGHVHVRANAVTQEDVAAFLRKLKESKYFEDVELNGDRANGSDGKIDITITCNVKYAA